MEIDLGKEIVIKVKMGAEVYELREPTLDDIERMTAVDKDDVKASNKALQEFIIGLGMPEDVVKSLGFMRMTKLAKGLTSSFSEGK